MTFSPQNELEEVLVRAAAEPAHRPEFFSVLMDATVFVLGGDENDQPGEKVLPADSHVSLLHWEKSDGSTAIPFFSSLAALQMAVTQEQSFLALPARSLFELTRGETLFLNPKLPYGKEFMPQEVEHMLSGEGNGLVQQRVIEEDSRILIGQPAEMPTQMIDSLTRLFAKHRQVRRAWVAQIQEGKEEAHLLIGLELESDEEAIIQAAGSVASDTLPDDRPVDICLVDKEDNGGVGHYFLRHATPFYERKWGSFLRDAKLTGKA